MTTVQAKIQAIEDKKYRDALLEREARNSKVSKMFFDDRQLKLYPLANQISTPETYESLQIPDPDGETAEKTESIFTQHMMQISGGDRSFSSSMLSKLSKAGFDAISLSFLNASMSDIKAKMKSQFNHGRTTEDAVFLFLKKYVQTFDSNHDGQRDAQAAAVDSDSDDESIAKATPVQSESVLLTPSKSKSKSNLFSNIARATATDKALLV
jgi:hypothetical protein